jgi:hypothetical protein
MCKDSDRGRFLLRHDEAGLLNRLRPNEQSSLRVREVRFEQSHRQGFGNRCPFNRPRCFLAAPGRCCWLPGHRIPWTDRVNAKPAPLMAHLGILLPHSRIPGSTNNSQPAFFRSTLSPKLYRHRQNALVRPFVENATRPHIKKWSALPYRTPTYHLAIMGFVSELVHFDKVHKSVGEAFRC